MKHSGLKEQWKPGQSGNPAGRPKGSRNRLAEAFVEDIYAAWQTHGAAAIQALITDKPGDFVKVVASVLPKEFSVKDASLSDMSDEQIMEMLATIRAMSPSKPNGKTKGNGHTEH